MSDLSEASADTRDTAYFRIKCVVQELGARLDQDHDFRFDFNKPRRAIVRFAPDDSHSQDVARQTVVCSATCAAEIPTAIAAKLASPFKDDVAALSSLSSDELNLIDEIFGDLRSLLTSTIDVFRWRHGLVGGPIGWVEAFYSGDSNKWLKFTLARRIELGVGIPFKKSLKDVPQEEIVRLVEEDKQEPIAHQLLREAWELKQSNPRSALAIGMAAAEIGVKDLIAVLVPGAGWLVQETPSPPIVKMLRNYLPKLPVRGQFKDKRLKPPKELIRLIDKGTDFRNGLVHAGKPPPNWRELQEILRAVNDLLWICELYKGERWAGRYVSGNTTRPWPASE
jgi:hypothetical protein